MSPKGKNVLKFAVSAVVAAAFLYWAFRHLDFASFWAGLRSTRWAFILLSVLAAVLALVFRAERWRLQLQAVDPEIRRSRIWDGSNVGNLLNILLPGIGEFTRCGIVKTGKSQYEKVFGTILVERSFDVLAVIVIFTLSFFLQRDRLATFVRNNVIGPVSTRFNMSFWAVVAIAVSVVLLLCLVVWLLRDRSRLFRKLVDSVAGIIDGVASFGRMRHAFLFLFYTLGIWAMYVLMTWLTFLAVPGLEFLTLSDAMFISAVGNLASVVPTPGNLGPYHWLVGTALSDIYLGSSVITPVALLFATLAHGVHAVLLIVLGIISYLCIYLRKN